MTLEEKLLALDLEGFYIEESVLSPMQVEEVHASTKATLLEGAEKIFGSTFLNHNQSLAPYLANHKIMEVVRSLLGSSARIISTSGNMSSPSPEANPSPPGNLHVDWPWGQSGASYIEGTLPNVVINLTTFWMLTDFTRQNGATIVSPGTHKAGKNPNGYPELKKARPTEIQVEASAGSVLVFDGRLWHKGGTNRSVVPRIFWGVNYAPWWLNCHARRPCSVEHKIQSDAGYTPAGHWPYLKGEVHDLLPEQVRPLVRHWVDREWVMSKTEAEAAIWDFSYFRDE